MPRVQLKKKNPHFIVNNWSIGSSLRGALETNLTRIHEDAGLIPGLDQWVRDLALP